MSDKSCWKNWAKGHNLVFIFMLIGVSILLVGSAVGDPAVVPRDQVGVMISGPQSAGYYADCASDGSKYMVTWRISTTENVQLFDSTGSPLGSPVLIFPGTYGEDLCIAFGGSKYLVVDKFNTYYIRGTFIDTVGNPGSVFEIGSGISTASYPDVAYDPVSGNFLVVWGQYTTLGTGAKSQIFGQFVSPTTGLTGTKFQIGDTSRNNWHPIVTYGSGKFFVAYTSEEYSGSTNRDIYGARVNPDGSLPDSPDIRICTANGGQDLAAWGHSGITYDGTNYVVVWRDYVSYPDRLFAARISPEGTLLEGPAENGGKLIPGFEGLWQSQILYDGTSSVLVADGTNMKIARLDESLNVLDDPVITLNLNVMSYPSLASNGENFLVTWDRTQSSTHTLMGQILVYDEHPIANPGTNRSVDTGVVVTLDGSMSTDPDGNLPLTYTWSLVSKPIGSTSTIATPTSVTPSFTPDLEGQYVIRLVVKDSLLLSSAPVTITITASKPNNPPVLASIGDKTIIKGDSLTFLVIATDADKDALTYSAAYLPPGATFDSSTGIFAWTPNTYQLGTYYPVFRVSDGINEDNETVRITIQDPNAQPIAVVPNQFTNTVSTVDLSTNPAFITVLVNTVGQPLDVAVTPDYARALVSASSSGDVVFFDLTQTPAVEISRINIGGNPEQIAISPDGRKAIVGNSGNYNITILDISGTTPLILETMGFLKHPYGVGITNDGRYALVAIDSGPGRVYVIDLTTSSPSILYYCTSAYYGMYIGMDPTGKTAIVTTFDSAGKVTVIDLTTTPFTVKGIVNIGKNPGSEPAISPDGHYALAANADDDTVSVIDLTSTSPVVVQTIAVGDDPRGVGIIESENIALVTNRGPAGGSLTKIDLGTLTVTDTILGLKSPNHVSIYYQVKLNQPPVLDPIGAKSVDEGSPLTFTATATDSDLPAQTLTFSLVGAPEGTSINGDGVFTWTPTEEQGPESYTFDVVVSDGSTTDSETITVTVSEANLAPILGSIGDKTIDELSQLTFTATATNSDVPAQTLAFSLGGTAPVGAAIDATTGVFTWTPTEDQGSCSIEVIVSDGELTDSETITVTVNEVNVAPVLTPIGPQSVDEGSPLTFTATATDSDLPAQTLAFSLGGTAPVGAAIDATTGVFTWTPTEDQGSCSIEVIVSDGELTDSETITVTVNEANVAPILDPIGAKSVDEGSPLTFTATATDSDVPAQTLSFSLGTTAPAGAAITAGGDFTWSPTEEQGSCSIEVIVSDGALTDSETITVTVNEANVAPILDPIGAKSVDEGSPLTFTATATDSDVPAQTLTFSLGGTDPVGAAIDATTGVFTWTPTEEQGSCSIEVIVSDGALTDSETITVTVNEVNVAPILDPIGAKSVDKGSPLTFTATATDSDVPAQTLTFSLGGTVPAGAAITAGGDFTWTTSEGDGPGSYTFDVVVSDGALTDSETITVTVNDVSQPPSDTAPPIITTFEANPNPVPVNTAVTVFATIDDSSTGGSLIATAYYLLDGVSYPMLPSDGAWDEPIEDVTAIIPGFDAADVHDIAVTATDTAGNPAMSESILLAVYDKTVKAQVTLADSTGVPLDPATVQYYAGGWKEFGVTSGGVAEKELLPGTYSFRVSYGGATLDKKQDIGINPVVEFQTVKAQVTLEDSTGAPLDPGMVQYYAGGWKEFSVTSGGIAEKELLPGNYSFRMGYAGATLDKKQDVGTDTLVMFQTVKARVKLEDSTGAPLDPATVQYYAGGWKEFGPTSGGTVEKELLPGNYSFRMGYAGASLDRKQDVAEDSSVEFATTLVILKLRDSSGQLTDTGTASYYAGGWKEIGPTSGGIVTKELLPLSYTFRMSYGGKSNDIQQDVAIDPVVVFTAATPIPTVKLVDSEGNGISGAAVQYYAGGWKEFGTTDAGGSVSKDILPGIYTFRMSYVGASQDLKQDVSIDPLVEFQTVNVQVTLEDSAGAPLDPATIQYYAGGWKPFGTTTGGIAGKELLPGTYTFRASYEGASLDKKQDVGTDPLVMFQTVKAQVNLKDSTGTFLDTGTVQYYAGGWKSFGTTSGGIAEKELLPGSYSFRMAYLGDTQDIKQDISSGTPVVFSTGKVISDTGTCQQYYAGGWKPFTNGMELLPASYKFRFNDGTPDTASSIVSGMENHIH